MTLLIAAQRGSPSSGWARGTAKWLSLTASPTFALMAWASAIDGTGMTICSSAEAMLPIGGMVWMYLLMGVFHLSPWLTLASSRHRLTAHPTTRTEGD
jgi:hypothetical protein